jgi:hypothetical protein
MITKNNKKYRLIKINYSAKTNPEVMKFQVLVRNYSHELKQYDIKIRYVKNIKIPFEAELYDMNNKLQYVTQDYRRLKYIIRRVGYLSDYK